MPHKSVCLSIVFPQTTMLNRTVEANIFRYEKILPNSNHTAQTFCSFMLLQFAFIIQMQKAYLLSIKHDPHSYGFI